MANLYRVNYKTVGDKGISLNTTKLNVLLDRNLDPDIYTDEFREEVDINKILTLPYKLGCVSNKYNKCNLYINNRPCERRLLGIEFDSNRKLYALIFPDVYIILPEEIYTFLEISKESVGKTYLEEFMDTFNQTAMNYDLISTKNSKLQINVNKINQELYEKDELESVFEMYDNKFQCKDIETSINDLNKEALEELDKQISMTTDTEDKVLEEEPISKPKRQRKSTKPGRRVGK